MSSSRQFFIRLAIIVIVWYLGLSYLPQIVGTCFDGECGFSIGGVIVSLASPERHRHRPVQLDRNPHRGCLPASAARLLPAVFAAHEFTAGDTAQLAVVCLE